MLLTGALPVYAAESNLCNTRGYTVGFFNGVWNTPYMAYDARVFLKNLLGIEYTGESVEYENFYNTTGEENGATMAQDIAETFIQRADEIDSSGELARRFEYLWDAASDPRRPLWARLVDVLKVPIAMAETIYTAISTKLVAGFARMLSNPPTEMDYAEHRLLVDKLTTEGQKILLVAHSQGNLFMNPAYDYAKTKLTTDSVATVHIAPASMTVRGPHLLADIDLVINGLRAFGWSAVPGINLALPSSGIDKSGHTLDGTYLDDSRPGRMHVRQMADQGLASLVTPPASGNRGFFTTMLTWDGVGDVDLHTTEPEGTYVNYANRTGQVGALDVDNTVANGPEHYYASCNLDQLKEGTYRFGINNYRNATGRKATMQVTLAQGGQPVTRVVDVGPERGPMGNSSPIEVMAVNVTKDANGKFVATAQ
ncbi:hypothetical protein [Comamonas endophytica]|uniref:Uncharacterized protein n=1 Tax=Comamonas endophytica TaxID=2949090 RepID=A0ABY6GEV4_9BURK|nr:MULTISPECIES: hypothetical protein [unclassified Acidovorax]MCD2512795.1 hypothetical protein [Acidovorax sp. D4N7]UYG52855.1 hypothetical protein M9799_06340 [Acidovorax sp. 5MLIR]